MATTGNATHTPGPWKVEEQHRILGADGVMLAKVFLRFARGEDGPTEDLDLEREVNARLIASAPEMLAELENFVGSCCACSNGVIWRKGGVRESCPVCSTARVLLARIEGKE